MTIKVHYDRDEYSLHAPREKWCREHIGKGSWGDPRGWTDGINTQDAKWAIQSIFGETFFYFREEKDAMMFVLKWGPGL